MKPHALTLLAAIAVALSACQKASDKTSSKGVDSVSSTAAASSLAIAPLAFSHRRLANGLDVYAMPDPNTANVSVQVWYRVGSKDDPKDRSGFAHLFEHIMFKTTRNMPAEFFDRLTEDVGGFNNASTYDDFTNYYEVVPANHLERILWAEAERMGSLVVDESVFDSERDVVKEELRQRVLASPYGRLFYLYVQQANYQVHPYGRPGIGSIEDLDAATVDDVRAFHTTYYRPDNAVLVVAGNFDPSKFDQWVDKYFGPLNSPDRAIPKVDAVEPARTGAKTLTTYAPNVPLPAVMLSYPGLAASDADTPALQVLDAIMTRGESSRFYQSLVYTQQIAANAFSFYEATRDPSVFSVAAILSEGKSADDGAAALRAELARLRDGIVTAAELDEAKNELITAKLEERETAFGRAFELAESVVRYDDPSAGDSILASIQKVTADDIQRVARRVFDEAKSTTILYLNEEDATPENPGDTIATASTIEAGALPVSAADAPLFSLAAESERVAPPTPAAPVSAKIAPSSEKTLANGMKVIVTPNRALPLISANLRFAAGAGADPANLAGLADMTATLSTKGTQTRTATDIAQAVEALGASLSASAGADSTTVSLFTRADRRDAAFDIFSDVVRAPIFADEELDRARQQSLDSLSVSLGEPGEVLSLAMPRILFGAAPYGGVASERSLKALTRDAATAFHAQNWRPENGVLVIVGDVSPDEGFALAEAHFGAWAPVSAAARQTPSASDAIGVRKLVIDLPETGQAAVAYGLKAVERTHADYFPTLLATTVLGGGYSARLNAEIRIKRGLSYGASARLPARRLAAPIVASAQTRNDAAVEVAQLIEAELARIGAEAVAGPELSARKASLVGGFGRSVETTSGLADELSSFALFDLPASKLQDYVADIERISAEDVTRAAARYLNPADASIVIVGDAAIFWDEFKEKHPDAVRLSIDDLNLDSATLK